MSRNQRGWFKIKNTPRHFRTHTHKNARIAALVLYAENAHAQFQSLTSFLLRSAIRNNLSLGLVDPHGFICVLFYFFFSLGYVSLWLNLIQVYLILDQPPRKKSC